MGLSKFGSERIWWIVELDSLGDGLGHDWKTGEVALEASLTRLVYFIMLSNLREVDALSIRRFSFNRFLFIP